MGSGHGPSRRAHVRGDDFVRVGRHVTNETLHVDTQHIDEDQALGMLDGTLTSSERAHIEKHVDACVACRELLSDLAQQSGFHGKPNVPALPVTAEFEGLAIPLHATRHSPRHASVVEVVAPEVKRPISTPPSPAAVPASPSRKTLWVVLAVGVGLGLFASALLLIVVGGAGLFYAGGRLVAEPSVAPFTPVAPAPQPPPEPMPIAPLLNIPGVAEMLGSPGGEQLLCNSDLGVVAHREFTTSVPTFGFQAMNGCEVVLEDVTFRNGHDFAVAVIQIAGDESVHVTVRHSRVEGDVIVVGQAQVVFEDCTILGTITGHAIVR